MSEKVYFEHNEGRIVVSDQRFTVYNQTVDVANIDDFDLEDRRTFNGISISLNDGLKIGTTLVQLVLISPLGRKPAFVPVDLRCQIDQVQLRGIVLGLSRAIAERKQNASHHRQLETSRNQTPPPLSRPITVANLPRTLSRAESKILNLIKDPGEEYEAMSQRFTAAISILLSGAGLRGMNHPVTVKVIYEYQRIHGHRNTTLGILGNSGVTVGSVFRPLLQEEVSAFEDLYNQVSQSPLPQSEHSSEV